MNEITIDKNAKQITFTNNGIGFSQFGTSNEILDLIENQTKEIERLNNIINELEKFLYKIERDTEKDIQYARSKNDDEEVIRLNRDFNMCDMILDKLEELKGVDKE